MFGQYSYLFYTLIFTLPLTFILWVYYFPLLQKNSRVVFLTTFILTLYGFFLWPLAIDWKAWAYSPDKILGVKIFDTHLEDILWWFLIVFLLSSFAVVLAQKEEKKESIFERG